MSVSFSNITNNGNSDLSAQLELIVSTVAGDPSSVDFIFHNNVGIQSSVSEVYFDDGNPAASIFDAGLESQTGANFNFGSAAPGDLPGGNSLADPFDVSAGFLADAQGNPSVGLDQAGDELVIRAELIAGVSFQDIVDRLNNGDLRVGLHIRSIDPQGGSDSYVTEPPRVIPLPGAAGMGLLGLGVVASRRRR